MLVPPLNKSHSRYFHLKYALVALEGVKGKILDVGCGKGGITANLKKEKPKMDFFACDNDKDAIASFNKNYKELGIRVKICDAQKLAFEDNFFDAVVMFDVLEHLENPKKSLREIYRVLKKDGVFHLVVPIEAELTTFDGWIKRFFGKNLKEKPIGHINQFLLREVLSMLSDAGLTPKKTRFSYHFSYQLFSLIYYFYVAIFRRGEYLSLSSKKKSVNKIISLFSWIGGFIAYVESSILKNVRGQTAHITAVRLTKYNGII